MHRMRTRLLAAAAPRRRCHASAAPTLRTRLELARREVRLAERDGAASAASAASASLTTAMPLWRSELSGGGGLDRTTLSVLLSLCQSAKAPADALDVFRRLGDAHVPKEGDFATVVRAMAESGDVPAARRLLGEMGERGLSRRPRSYNPIVQALARGGDAEQALQLIDDMAAEAVARPASTPNAGTYLPLLDAAKGRGLGAALPVLQRWRTARLAPDADSVAALRQCLGEQQVVEAGEQCLSVLHPGHRGADCGNCGAELPQPTLGGDALAELSTRVSSLIGSDARSVRDLQAFDGWLERREAASGVRFDAVIDAANVGLSNWHGGKFSAPQLEAVVDALRAEGRVPLVVAQGVCWKVACKQPHTKLALERLAAAVPRSVYVTPLAGRLDDVFVLYAALRHEARALLISNDEFADHRQLLPEGFERWRSGHQLRFAFDDRDALSWTLPAASWPEVAHAPPRWHVPLADETGRWLCIGE